LITTPLFIDHIGGLHLFSSRPKKWSGPSKKIKRVIKNKIEKKFVEKFIKDMQDSNSKILFKHLDDDFRIYLIDTYNYWNDILENTGDNFE